MAEEKKTSKKTEKADKPKDTKKKSRKNPFKSIASFFKSVKSEGKKVVWAKPKDVFKNTIIVLVVVFIVGLGIFAVDSLLSQGMKGIKNLAQTETSASVTQQAEDSSDEEETTEAEAENTTAQEESTTKAAE